MKADAAIREYAEQRAVVDDAHRADGHGGGNNATTAAGPQRADMMPEQQDVDGLGIDPAGPENPISTDGILAPLLGLYPQGIEIIAVNCPSNDAGSFRKSEAQITGMLARAVSRGTRTL